MRSFYGLTWFSLGALESHSLKVYDQDEAQLLFANLAGRPVVTWARLHYYPGTNIAELVMSFG